MAETWNSSKTSPKFIKQKPWDSSSLEFSIHLHTCKAYGLYPICCFKTSTPWPHWNNQPTQPTAGDCPDIFPVSIGRLAGAVATATDIAAAGHQNIGWRTSRKGSLHQQITSKKYFTPGSTSPGTWGNANFQKKNKWDNPPTTLPTTLPKLRSSY